VSTLESPLRQLALLSFLLAAPLAIASAQDVAAAKPAPSRDGFYIGFGLGSGKVSYTGDLEDAEAPDAGLSGHFRLGGTLNQQWRLGAETNGWVKQQDGLDFQYSALLGTATFYPSPTGNFFIKGGLGIAAYSEEYAGDEIMAAGGAWTLGLGYDFRFSGKTGISLVGNYVTGSNWQVEFNGEDTGFDTGVALVQVGVGVIWH
jgi:hypothetical protein